MYSEFFHNISRNHRSSRGKIPRDPADWPASWLTTVYKAYVGAERIVLRRPALAPMSFTDVLSQRKSRRDFSGEPINLDEVSSLMLYSCGLHAHMPDQKDPAQAQASTRRAHPSPGGLYPIEAYVVNMQAGEVPAGVFHYNVKEHSLEIIERRSFSSEYLGEVFVESSAPAAPPRFAHEAACVVILTAVFDRTQNKYGERGYRYCLIEAGHIGQNLALVCASLGLSCTMMGGVVDEAVDSLIRVDGAGESLVYAAVIGRGK